MYVWQRTVCVQILPVVVQIQSIGNAKLCNTRNDDNDCYISHDH